jgi:crotonobetainyl-CoA:carnitine CoA-transferase CaiB-like acyl-CoA transferase
MPATPETRARHAGDGQVVHKQTVARYPMRDVGAVQLPRAAALSGVTPNPTQLQAPHAGEHGREPLRQLGRSDAEIDALFARRAVR